MSACYLYPGTMARNRKKKSLYEVISKTWPKPGRSKTLERIPPEESGECEPTRVKYSVPSSKRASQWPGKPRIVQFNAGRIEISIPYEIAIALLLGIILLVLVVFRLGQNSGGPKTIEPVTKTPKRVQKQAEQTIASRQQVAKTDEKTRLVPASAEIVEAAKPKGSNRIVIQTYLLRAHLEPVKDYFAQAGIETEIKKMSDWYYLVTSEKYENPKKSGTNGYFAKQKIIQLGAKYKAPPGYETFGSKPFHDAYGKRFDD